MNIMKVVKKLKKYPPEYPSFPYPLFSPSASLLTFWEMSDATKRPFHLTGMDAPSFWEKRHGEDKVEDALPKFTYGSLWEDWVGRTEEQLRELLSRAGSPPPPPPQPLSDDLSHISCFFPREGVPAQSYLKHQHTLLLFALSANICFFIL